MDSAGSDEDLDFIKRANPATMPPEIIVNSCDSRPCTPPMDHSLKLNKSLGLMVSPQSPPYRRIRSMKLIESPKSFPKNIFEQHFSTMFSSTPAASPGLHSSFRRLPRSAKLHRSRHGISLLDIKDKINLSDGHIPAAYINPFTPNGRAAAAESRLQKNNRLKRTQRSCTFDSDDNDSDGTEDHCPSQLEIKKPKLCDFNFPRFEEEFLVVEVLGTGVHGCVYKCLHLLNGCEYAVKKGLRPVNNEKMAFNEIYAHAALDHPYIVRNYSCWTEDNVVFMQNEYCNGGSLEEALKTKGPLEEKELIVLLEHLSQGLRFIHARNLAHLDIKPGNIFISKGPRLFLSRNCKELDDDEEDSPCETLYKIGDLGHVVNLEDETMDVEEGDCRYLPREMLNDDYTSLTKVDIFSLGLTLYEAAGGGPLPKNGEDWHSIREGKIKLFPNLSTQFNRLLKKMIHPQPDKRPSACEILQTIYMSTPVLKELKEAKHRIQVLEQQLSNVTKCYNALSQQSQDKRHANNFNNNIVSTPNHNTRSKVDRLVGKKSKKTLSNLI